MQKVQSMKAYGGWHGIKEENAGDVLLTALAGDFAGYLEIFNELGLEFEIEISNTRWDLLKKIKNLLNELGEMEMECTKREGGENKGANKKILELQIPFTVASVTQLLRNEIQEMKLAELGDAAAQARVARKIADAEKKFGTSMAIEGCRERALTLFYWIANPEEDIELGIDDVLIGLG